MSDDDAGHDPEGPDGHDARLRRDLARLDPAAALPAADPDRVARLLETTMSSSHPADPASPTDQPGSPRRRPRNRWLALAAAAAVLVAGGAVAGVVAGDDEPDPLATVTPAQPSDGSGGSDGSGETDGSDEVVLAAPPASDARCMVPTVEAVARTEIALDATVADVSGDQVRLEVSQWYAGATDDGATPAGTVVLTNPVDLRAAIGGVPDFEVGQRWLVAASRGTVAVCGFTAPWTPARARVFEQAFPS